jgi:signal transduction histidine kinase
MQRYIENEEQILHRIVKGIVEDLKYTGAMVATYESGDALPVRAFYVNPSIAKEKEIQEWEDQVRKISPHDQPISLTDPAIARVYVHQDKYKDNLSAKAAQEKKPVTSNDLFDLFIPIAPEISRPFVKGIQEGLGIKQVIAVPFFLGEELVGNLFAATQSERFNTWEIEVLQAFGQNAAAGIRNARIYKRSEDRREAAQIFGRMAFSAATNVHAFNGHMGVIRGNISILDNIDAIANDNEKRREILNQIVPPIKRRIEDVIVILEKLHTPWQIQPDTDVDVTASIEHALTKLFTNWKEEKWISFESQDLPTIKSSQEMLVETFRILIKNAYEAIVEKEISLRKNERGLLAIESRLLMLNDSNIIEITICDSGIGIKPENFEKVFEMRWSTKSTGLGFGLFWVKDYIEGLGGKIFFDSIVNEGTKFTVHLPVRVNVSNINDV